MNENIRQVVATLAHEVDALAQVVADSRCSSELIGIRIRNSWAEIGPKLLHAANMWDAAQRPALTLVGVEREQRQQVVVEWGARCFGVEHMADKIVRAARFFEEAAELVQAVGLSRDHALRAFDHVYGRSAGEPWQEAGGVGVTLMALCNALGLSADDCEVKEIARCLSKSPESFAARNVAKIEQVDAPALLAQSDVVLTEELLFGAHQALAYVARNVPTGPSQREAESRAETFKAAADDYLSRASRAAAQSGSGVQRTDGRFDLGLRKIEKWISEVPSTMAVDLSEGVRLIREALAFPQSGSVQCREDVAREAELRILHTLGAAISRRDWHATEQAHAAIRDKIHANVAREPAGQSIEGWRLVPVEPTREQFLAFKTAYEECPDGQGYFNAFDAGYTAAVNAAPQPREKP